MSTLAAVLVLALVIVVHELGHFLVAKWCDVGVLEFAIGFGKRLFSYPYGETIYSIRAIPLGGFVRMAGDDPFEIVERERRAREGSAAEAPSVNDGGEAGAGSHEHHSVWLAERVEQRIEDALGEDGEALTDEEIRARSIAPERWLLRKGFLAKAAIVLAGPLANLIFAVVVSFALLLAFGRGERSTEPVIGDLIPNYPAAAAGLQKGDRVLTVNGKAVASWDELSEAIWYSPTTEIQLDIERQPEAGGEPRREHIAVTAKTNSPELAMIEGRPTNDTRKLIGIDALSTRVPVTLREAAVGGVQYTLHLSVMTVRLLQGLVTMQISHKNIGSPIMIMQEAYKSAQKGAEPLFNFLVLLSVSLGVLNLLPIPILDGGHLVFFMLEAIRRKPLSLKFQQIANQVGLVVLLALMLLALSNDIFRLAGGS